MSIFVNKDSKVIVQGITGGEGTKHTARMLAAGTNIVGGVNARKAGTTVTHKAKDGSDIELNVYGSVAEAMEKTGANVSIVFVPPAFTKAAVLEAIEAKIGLVVVITEGVPVQDSAEFWAAAKASVDENGKQITRIIGPNCPRHHLPRGVPGWYYPGEHHRQGQDWSGFQVRYPDLPADVRTV